MDTLPLVSNRKEAEQMFFKYPYCIKPFPVNNEALFYIFSSLIVCVHTIWGFEKVGCSLLFYYYMKCVNSL